MLLNVKTVSNGNTAVTVDPQTTVAQLKQILDQQGSFAGLGRPWKLVSDPEALEPLVRHWVPCWSQVEHTSAWDLPSAGAQGRASD